MYDYSPTIYTHSTKMVSILCRTHGIYEQVAGSHLRGLGCPVCKNSKGETAIRTWLTTHNISFTTQHSFRNCMDKRELKFDYYVPAVNTAIEYDGELHYKSVSHFGGEEYLQAIQRRDKIKTEYCVDNNIRLIRIPYWDLKNIAKILETHI